ncbi:MAG TPA: GNAT family N-acetyltransferase, partial [Elusimicrobiales bacterium]|nr:GNAT family N-acetyltransferase [Elusimicrobiales bacterium]
LYRSSEALRVLLSEYSRLLSAPDVLSGTLIANPMSFDESVESCYKQQVPADYVDDRICQVSNLPEFTTEEALLSGFKQKTRNLVRKSLQQGFALRIADDDAAWDFLHAVHQENMAAIGGRAKPKSHFDALRRHIPKEWRKLFIAEKNGAPVAALLNLYYKKTVEYISPVIKQEHRAAQPLSFLIWHAMADAARNGYRRWVWGGTWKTQSSLHHFKAGWGAKDHPYCYLVRARAESRDRIKQDRDKILGAFAYYYVIPFQALEGA